MVYNTLQAEISSLMEKHEDLLQEHEDVTTDLKELLSKYDKECAENASNAKVNICA